MPGRLRPRGTIWSSWEHPGLKRGATSRCHAEPRMNEAGLAAFSGARYFGATIASSVVTRRRRARMGNLDHHAPRRPRMTVQAKLLFAVAISGFAALAATSSAQALTTQECSAKYQAAKAAGTLGAQKWNDFRKAQCAADAAAAPAAPAGPAVFPTAVDPKYSKETAGKGRMHTCVDQYNANKAGNANGGLKWIQKGGGYYSECTKKLKG